MTEKDALTVLLEDLGAYVCNPDEDAFIAKETVLQAITAIQCMSAELATLKNLLRDGMIIGRK